MNAEGQGAPNTAINNDELYKDNLFYLPGYGEPGRENDFWPMTGPETAEANARYQEHLYKKMEREMPQRLAKIVAMYPSQESDTESSEDEETPVDNEQNRASNGNHRISDTRSPDELEMLIDVRTREVKRLKHDIDTIKHSMQKQIDHLETQLKQISNEKEAATTSLDETQKLLRSTIAKSAKLDGEIAELKRQNEELTCDLRVSKLTCDDLQKNIIILSKGSSEKVELIQLEKIYVEREEKLKKELLQSEMDCTGLKNKYKSMEMENLELEKRARKLSKNNAELMEEKAEAISRMTKELENLKEQLAGGSIMELQRKIAKMETKEEELQSQLRSLQKRYDDQLEELRLVRATPPSERLRTNQDGTLTLHSELLRACADVKSQRAEIAKLEAVLHEKEALEITHGNELTLTRRLLADREAQINQLEVRLREEISKKVEEQNVSLSDDQKVTEINEENEKLRKELEMMQQHLQQVSTEVGRRPDAATLDKYNEQYLKFHEEKMDSLRKELEEYYEEQLRTREAVIENLRAEIEDVKNQYIVLKESQASSLDRLQSQEKEIENLRERLREKDSGDGGAGVAVRQLQEELEASRKRVIELSKSVIEHCKGDTNDHQQQMERLIAEKQRVESELKESESLVAKLSEQIKESMELISTLRSNLDQFGKEREIIKVDYEARLKAVRDELQKKMAEAESEMNVMREQLRRKTPEMSSTATSPPRKRFYTEEEIMHRLEMLAEVHEKELRDLELQYSLTLAKHIQQLRASSNAASEQSRKTTADVATNTENPSVLAVTADQDPAGRQVVVEQYKQALDAALKECDDLRRRLLEEEVNWTTEMRYLTEKHESYKSKVRRYKTNLNDALRHIHQEFGKEKERYERTLNEIQKEVVALRRARGEALADVREEATARLYDERIDLVKKLLQNFENKR